MEIITGIVFAIVIAGLARVAGFDRDRSFYPVLLIVIASYYVLFAVMAGAPEVLIKESIVALVFIAIAIVSVKRFQFVVAIGLAVHGVFDIFHDSVIVNKAVPLWWPGFCAAVDIFLGLWVLFLLRTEAGKPYLNP